MLVGTVKVKNVSFHKEVMVRSTWDNWKTQQDTICTFTPVSLRIFIYLFRILHIFQGIQRFQIFFVKFSIKNDKKLIVNVIFFRLTVAVAHMFSMTHSHSNSHYRHRQCCSNSVCATDATEKNSGITTR